MARPIITCKSCNEVKEHYAHGLCGGCYRKQYSKTHLKERRERRYRRGENQPMSQNKQCSSFLGVYIAERVLSKVFDGVQRMKTNNPNYDFICSNGYKIDVKASCRIIRDKHADNWMFNTKYNKIPNYFLCIAFDNRTDLNPEHIWLIPGDVVNMKKAFMITETKLNNWQQYEKSINKVINQCDILRGN